MPRRTITIDRPFTGGEITDLSPADLNPQQAQELRDAMIENGVITARPEYSAISFGSHLNANEEPTGVWVGSFDFAGLDPWTDAPDAAPRYIVTTSDGRILDFGTDPTGTPTAIDCASFRIDADAYLMPAVFYRGELLLTWSDGLSPILRYAGRTTAGDSVGGTTISFDFGSTTIAGSGTNFTTQVGAGSYIKVSEVAESYVFRVVEVVTNTKLIVAEPMPVAGSALDWNKSRVGQIGLQTEVDGYGLVTSTGTTVTGNGTRFTRAIVGDQMGLLEGEDEAMFVASISDDDTLTLDAAPTADFNADSYRITRRMFGRCVAYHRGRLWFAGGLYANRRLSYSPPDYALGELYNENDSPDVNLMRAVQADFEIVGGDDAPTAIEALVSTGYGPLLAITGDEVWEIHGEPPNLTIVRRADNVGCLDRRSVVTYRGRVMWASEDGLVSWTPGGSMTFPCEGRVETRWQEVVTGNVNIGSNSVIGWRDGERVFMSPTNNPRPIVYDADRDVWLGRWDFGSHAGGNGAVRAAWVPSTFGEVAETTLVHYGGSQSAHLIGAGGSVKGPASFRAVTGENLLRGHQFKRIVAGQVRYRMGYRTGGFNQQVSVYHGNSPDPCAVLTSTLNGADGTGYKNARLNIKSSVTPDGDEGGEDDRNTLGTRARVHKLTFSQDSLTQPREFELTTIYLEVRERHPRA